VTIKYIQTVEAASAEGIVASVYPQRNDQIRDADVRSVVEWAAATRLPGAKILLSPPFSRKNAPEIIGTAVFFHYINRNMALKLGRNSFRLHTVKVQCLFSG
jgi:hypothetical protein